MKLNNLTQKNVLNFTQIYYLLNAYVNMNIVYFQSNHRNGLIYFDTDEVKNNKMFNLRN